MPAAPDTSADLGGNPNSADLFVTRTREIPLARKCSATPASRTLRRSPTALRPEVEAILLHGARPVAQQIAAALSGATVFTRSTSSPTAHRVGSALPPATSMLMF